MEEKTQQGTAITNKEDKSWIGSELEVVVVVGDPAEKTTAVSLELFWVDLMQRVKRSRMTTEAVRISHM